jgi:cytoskeletal protein CcmA (bactofilin family)
MKKVFLVLLISLTLVVAFPVVAVKAFSIKTDNSISLAKEEVADGNIYANCQEMTIDGTVRGDVVTACKNITINGVVMGDVISVSQNLTINGEIKGNVRSLAQTITINGIVGHNLNAIATNITFGQNSSINWDALVLGTNLKAQGVINGNLNGLSTNAFISGKIGRNINLHLNGGDNVNPSPLIINKNAVINGSLTYYSSSAATIESPSSITGQIIHQQPETTIDYSAIAWGIFYKLLSALLIGSLIFSFRKEAWQNTIAKMNDKYWLTILTGFGVLVLGLPIIVLCALTVIGWPLALIMLTFWIIAIYFSLLVASFSLGEIIRKNFIKKTVPPILILGLGLLIVLLLSTIPYFGSLLEIVMIIWGLGGIALNLKEHLKK